MTSLRCGIAFSVVALLTGCRSDDHESRGPGTGGSAGQTGGSTGHTGGTAGQTNADAAAVDVGATLQGTGGAAADTAMGGRGGAGAGDGTRVEAPMNGGAGGGTDVPLGAGGGTPRTGGAGGSGGGLDGPLGTGGGTPRTGGATGSGGRTGGAGGAMSVGGSGGAGGSGGTLTTALPLVHNTRAAQTPGYNQLDSAYGGLDGNGRFYCGPCSASNGLMWLDDHGFDDLVPNTADRKKDGSPTESVGNLDWGSVLKRSGGGEEA